MEKITNVPRETFFNFILKKFQKYSEKVLTFFEYAVNISVDRGNGNRCENKIITLRR